MGNLKAIVIGCCVLGGLFVAGSRADNQPAPPVGRYQLVSGRYYVILKGKEPALMDGVLRMDTSSGQVWEMVTASDDAGKREVIWVPFKEHTTGSTSH
jgi:hypothetical protein